MTDLPSVREDELLRQQNVLARFGEFALKSEDLDDILNEACRLVGQALGTEFAKVLETRADRHSLLVRAGIGWRPGVVGHTVISADPDTSLGYALRHRAPVISADIETEDRFDYPAFLREHGVRALANVPILGSDGDPPYGLLEVDSRIARAFTATDTNFLRSYANLLGAAVERLRLLTEMRDTAEALRESEDHFRATAELSPQIPWTASPEGHVTSFSERWLELTGMSREAALGDGWSEVPHPDDRGALRIAWARATETGQPFDIEARIRTADGGYRWMRLRAFPRRGAAGRVIRWYGTADDVEARRQMEAALRSWAETLEDRVAERTRALEQEQRERQMAEEKLRQSQKMEAVGQLTGGLAHDFNNLLTGIAGSLELLQTRVEQGRTNELARYLDSARVAVDRAAALTHRMLAFARRQTLDPRLIQPNDLVAGLEELLRRTVGPAITLRIVRTPGLGHIRCDPNQLENALLNLVINARDAMPLGGTLQVETANADIDENFGAMRDLPAGAYVRITVSDTGVGMSPDIIARAFDPFFTTKPLGEGTGLGLSMIYGFARQSGGQVRIHSRVGVGTSVSLYLPRHAGEDEAAHPQPADARPMARAASGENVLVVDDEPGVRMLIVEVLGDLGYQAIEAADGTSGLRQLDRHAALDLLVTDIGLPGGMNGRQLADAARARLPGLKILLITGYAETMSGSDVALEPGMAIMTKPFTMKALARRIQELLAA